MAAVRTLFRCVDPNKQMTLTTFPTRPTVNQPLSGSIRSLALTYPNHTSLHYTGRQELLLTTATKEENQARSTTEKSGFGNVW